MQVEAEVQHVGVDVDALARAGADVDRTVGWLFSGHCDAAQAAGKIPLDNNTVYLQVKVAEGGQCRFGYSLDGKKFTEFGKAFSAREGKWIGAKVGIFCSRQERMNDGGFADVDWFRIDNIKN